MGTNFQYRFKMLAAFIDESKEKRNLFAVVLVPAARMTEARRKLTDLVFPRQRSILFSKENMRRRKQIISAMLHLNLDVVILKTQGVLGNTARERLLIALMRLSQERGIRQLVIDLDESSAKFDQFVLAVAKETFQSDTNWDFKHRNQEPLLWVADAVAWCLNRGAIGNGWFVR